MSMSKIALAIPLSLGIACSTAGAQRSEHTGANWTAYEPSDGSMPSDRPARGTGADVSSQPAASGETQSTLSVQPASDGTYVAAGSSDSSGSSGSMGSSGSSDSSSSGSSGSSGASGSSDTGGSSGGSMGAGGSSETMGSGSPSGSAAQGGTSGSSDQAQQGASAGAGNVGAHEGDQHVMGKVSKVSKDEISIKPKSGQAKTLKIKPETTVSINGKDAKPSQLKPGQWVRASYENVSGDDVAVKIESGKMRHGQSGHMMKRHGGSSGSSGAAGSESSGGAESGGSK